VAVIGAEDQDDPREVSPLLFVILTSLCAIIAIGAVWLALNYADRASIPWYWGRVAAVGVLGGITLAGALRYERSLETHKEGDPSERQVGISELARDAVFAAYVGVATWDSITRSHWWTLACASFLAITLVVLIWQTREFLEQLDHRRYRGAASSTEWGWLLMAVLAGQGALPSGTKLLGAGVAAAVAIPFALYLRRLEEEAVAHLPLPPAPTALPGDDAAEEGADGPWEGLPPIKRLL
jgi:hypothetical protein